ncbi:MAG TPA: glycosyltransferase family 1 protein [Vicinamibacterales bacterium]
MRIGVDGRAFASPAGGVRRYVSELYRAIRELDPAIEVVAIGADEGVTLPEGVSRRGALALPTNLGWMAASLPLAVKGAGLSVFHAPAYQAPLWGVHPLVLTIHDVSYARHPEWHPYRNDPFRRAFYRQSARGADRIITDSEFSRSEITAAYGSPLERVSVVPLAASPIFTPGACAAGALPADVRQPYALHVGDLHARRNLKTALAAVLAVRRLRELESSGHQGIDAPILVCAGIDRGVAASLRDEATRATDPDALVLTGPLEDAALLNLYRGASMLLYPSRYEGFGLPVLEAMQCGIPVVAARATSIPELTGNAAVLLGPEDVEAWSQAIVEILEDATRRTTMSEAGIRRAAEFSWTRTAAETLAILREVAQRRK